MTALRDLYANDEISMLDLELTAEAEAASPLVAALIAAGALRVFPRHPVFVYWNASSYECEWCGRHGSINRVHLDTRVSMCRSCVDELSGLGMMTR